MERLVFNTAEHKLEELEKYGFKMLPLYTEYGRVTYYTFYGAKFKIVVNYDLLVEIIYIDNLYNIENQFERTINNTALCILYDLIKDGLVVKEKKDEHSHCN